jgi:hypothetical protein
MPTPPSDPSGFIPSYLFDPDTISGANNSSVTSYGGVYSVPSGFTAPTLKTNALNGYKTLNLAVGRALSASLSSVTPPPGNLSGGAFPVGFSMIAVFKATSLTALTPVSGGTGQRRALVGLRTAPSGWSGVNAWTLKHLGQPEGTARQEGLILSTPGSGSWGDALPSSLYPVSVGGWVVAGLTCDGATMKLYKGYSLDRTSTNPENPSLYTQWINAFTLGADLAYPGLHDFEGELAYFAPYNRALTQAEYISVAEWLVARFGFSPRSIAVSAETGTAGKAIYVTLSDLNGNPTNLTNTINRLGISYRINGGTATVPSALIRPSNLNGDYRTATFGIPLPSAVASNATITLSIASGAAETDLGLVDELTDGPVTNRVGQATLMDTSAPVSYTLKMGYNISSGGSYYKPEVSYKNAYKGLGSGEDTGSLDADGYYLEPPDGRWMYLRVTESDATPGSRSVVTDYPALEFGRYVVTWEGADGSNLLLDASYSDAGQTTVTPVTELDVLTGATKKRYFDVTETPGSIRKRPTLAVRYVTGVYCKNIEVKLARYEGTSGYYTDQIKERLNGMEAVRFMDFIPSNFSNIGKAADFNAVTRAYYGTYRVRTIPISRIEAWTGPYWAPTENHQHWKITFSTPHGLTNGQDFLVESTNGSPVNVTFSDGQVRDVTLYDDPNSTYPIGSKGHVISSTEFYFAEWRGTGYNHKTTSVAFTGANARAKVTVVPGAPIEMTAALVNEANVNTCNICIPHCLEAAGVTHMATVLANTLNAGKKVWVETSNEPWNPAFSQNWFFRAESVKRGLLPERGNNAMWGYAACSLDNFDTFSAAWVAAGRSASDLQLLVNVQYANLLTTEICATYLATNRPSLRVRLGIAPYYQPNPLQFATGIDYSTWTLEEVMDAHEAYFKAYRSVPAVPLHRAAFESRGMNVDITCYENQWGYMGLSPQGAGATKDERWESYNREVFAVSHHPRLHNIAWHQLKELQAAGIDSCEWYSYSYPLTYEYATQGLSTYGDYAGLLGVAGKGDGSDGKPDNRPLLVDGQGKAKWPDYYPRVSPRAGARRLWQTRLLEGGGTPPPPPDPPVGSFAIGPRRARFLKRRFR